MRLIDIQFIILAGAIISGLVYVTMGGMFERYREWRLNRKTDRAMKRLFEE